MIDKKYNEAQVKSEPAVKDLMAKLFAIEKEKDLGKGSLYHKFPLYVDTEDRQSVNADVLLVTQNYGVFVIKCLEYSDRTNLIQDDVVHGLNRMDTLLYAKIFKDAPKLQKGRRNLKINVLPVIYFSTGGAEEVGSDLFDSEITVIYEKSTLLKQIEDNQTDILTEEEFIDLIATIEGSKGIMKPSERILKDKNDTINSKGAILEAIERGLWEFDKQQRSAALFTIDGAQRIRGLAGSGKTIILAMKVAQLHLQDPNAEILYTYYTKSLHSTIKNYITKFYRQFADIDPNWDKIHIMHAWGGKNLAGVYYNTCQDNHVPPIPFATAKSFDENPFRYICTELDKHNSLVPTYDYVLLDEAQDFPSSFYRVCRKIVKKNRIIWAYDDFQNILNIAIQDEKNTFGKDENGKFYVDFSESEYNRGLNDLVLSKCYRTPRIVLCVAFALGLGIYNKGRNGNAKMVQLLENNAHWEDLGFSVEQGDSSVGSQMLINRPKENSPELKNQYLEGTIVSVKAHKDITEECKGVVDAILKDIEQELRPEDIMVICLDDRNVKDYFNLIEGLLSEKRINVFNLSNAPNDNTTFKVKNHVTLSTIYKAKGNESGSVHILGTDAIFSNKDSLRERNKLFTAITRSLAWVNITGTGAAMQYCINELNLLKDNDFKLSFIQPSERDVRTIQRRMTDKQARMNKLKKDTEALSKEYDLTTEEIFAEVSQNSNKK
ncbi:MAG: hypothetical protein RLZZ292_571 [Bacteroidota bacterium]|jgi:superfamily I DNA and RNA helicase